MTTRVTLQPAFVVHTRPFRDSSLIVELFTYAYGRVTTLGRGVRSRSSKVRGLLLPFVPLLISWSGKGELPTIGKIEPNGAPYNICGRALLSGLYLNELVVKCLQPHDPFLRLFQKYQHTLQSLQQNKDIQTALRLFEKVLLRELGYGLQLNRTDTREAIVAEKYYRHAPERGFVLTSLTEKNDTFIGNSLLALHNEKLVTVQELRDAKRLMRLVLNRLLGEQRLKSRELF